MSLYDTNLYKRLSPDLQNILISGQAFFRNMVRENHITWRVLHDLMKNQWLSPSELELLQLKELRRIVKVAQKTIPFYKSQFKKIGFHWEDLTSLQVFSQLPAITKETVLQNFEEFIPGKFARFYSVSGQTSGTTGAPLKLYNSLMGVIKEQSFLYRQRKWAGYSRGQRRVWIRGDLIVPINQEIPPFWRYNSVDNQLIMSSYHISKSSIPHYVQAIKEFSPAFIEAYPSSIVPIAAYMKNNGIQRIKALGVLTSSETLRESEKNLVEEMFMCNVYDWYGQYERVAAIGTCEHGNRHIIEDYGYTELTDCSDGRKEIVSTGFNNSIMPLIRYRTGDLVEPECGLRICPCGRSFRVVRKIIGRQDDFISLPDGRRVLALTFLFKGDIPISEAQIYQSRDYRIEIRVVPNLGFQEYHAGKILRRAKDRLGTHVPIKVVCVDKLKRTERGKLQMVVSEVKTN